ncbi:MAG TPA: 2-amino-4-hydroxy-6-hydroxymethyldihydropteridine diphosphokinase [Bosea sp. (in: a-proteobacteria)]|uniref:2-amino-4-hydroxy-6- hydroxymethyldihydropteridine diphosphokinase n=1 Tax=Bosea sp. (in: a-proteobacteria) TaxID=1871050 RepID=UPI002E109481|nr:2-amino-4-hydroxy-6-hydroxymethyldihydropteridine diphosphokinase [Bosea sp. (in: a-proteobacteria)]
MSTEVALGLGGNLGDPLEAFAKTLRALTDHPAVTLRSSSSVYRTKPWGLLDQPDFLNMAALLSTDLDEVELLNLCVELELASGRERGERWGPRTLDIDILTFGDLVTDRPRLQLPHPRIAKRAFVLVPLAEIAPELVIDGHSVASLMAALETDDVALDEAQTRRLREMLG